MLNLRFLSLALRSPRKLNNVTTSVNKYHSSFDSAPVITSLFDPQSDLYKENYSQMKNLKIDWKVDSLYDIAVTYVLKASL